MLIRLCLILLLSTSLFGASSVEKEIRDYVSTYEKTNDFSGCVLVKKKARELFSRCFGKANFEFGVANTQSTKFKIGSVSKQFTAAAILLLEEKGLLTTSDVLSKHLPDLPNADKITIHHLLTHTSGLTDIYSLPNYREINRKDLSLKEVTAEIFKAELISKPGAAYAYSNSGYTVLARVVEVASGKTYREFLLQNIFEPLKMTSTGEFQSSRVERDLAGGYDPMGYEGVSRPAFVSDVFFRGSGSLFSNTGDLSIWIDALVNGKILSDRSRAKLFKNHINNYGYGISVYKSFGKTVFGHDGRISGYIADYLYYREDGVSIIIVGNIQTGVADFLRRDIAAIVFGKEYKSRAKSIPAGQSSGRRYDKLAGRYQFGPNFFVYVETSDGVLRARANQGSYSELVPLEDGRYFSRVLYSYIDFERGDDGTVTKLIWVNNDGNKFVGSRVE